ncbi:MAG: hypothetical protein RLY86_381 [Pseudomonadota bacterium]|jgi:hypothetical protein
MYSDDDLNQAVAAGVLPPAAAEGFRRFVHHRRSAGPAQAGGIGDRVDEERFRLLTGFNDIFVAIAIILLLTAAAALAGTVTPAAGGFAVAALSWGLAEYFTRRRRMALPSIVLLAGFVGGLFTGMGAVVIGATMENLSEGPQSLPGLALAGAALLSTLGAWLHWRRFMVPITVAAGALGALAALFGLLLAGFPGLRDQVLPLVFIAGLVVFALAMVWDMRDPQRVTRATDVAFWLHLAAAPLIIHPVFTALGVTGGEGVAAGLGAALAAIGLYAVLALLSLVIDRRAMLVSALAYVLYALTAVLQAAGTAEMRFAMAALVIGSVLLLLSAGWHGARIRVLSLLPPTLRGALPAV